MSNIARFQIYLFCENLWASYGSIEGLEIVLPVRLYNIALDDAKALTQDKVSVFYFIKEDTDSFQMQTIAGVVTIRRKGETK